jgi:DhnA family fructose-bisphosphate aldolase class Ia
VKSLDKKLKRIRHGKYMPTDFIIADAKDGDMAFGVTSPGPADKSSWKPRESYLQGMQDMSASGLVDVMLMSVSSAEVLHKRGTFNKSAVTPAVRLNDTTDIWCARHSNYRDSPSQPFASADLNAVKPLSKLGLYSMTFSNDLSADKASLEAYRRFRLAAREAGIKHFLEIFNPAFDIGISAKEIGHYINDMIIKALAGVTSGDSPEFLKIQFNGAAAMQELASYDPTRLVAGILGGSAGTTRDTFELAYQAEQSGARVALFGRKINLAEAPLTLVELMRKTIEQSVTPSEAVREYHAALKEAGIKPQRSLRQDLLITEASLKG